MNTRSIDALAVIRRHAESHRRSAEVDAYSAQEAPRLEAALAAFEALVKAAKAVRASRFAPHDHVRDDAMSDLADAIDRVEPQA
jgi:hypothetical protein